MSLLWINAASYDDYDYSQPEPSRSPKPSDMPGAGETSSRPRGCGYMTPEQERSIAHAAAAERNSSDLGNGSKGWYCHDCSEANGYGLLHGGGRSIPNPGAPPEPPEGSNEWFDWRDQHTREPTPAEEIGHGAVYHTSTPEGIRVGKPLDHEGCYDTTDAAREHRHQTGDYDTPYRYPPDYEVDRAVSHPHVGIQYGHEHHPEGHRMHRAEALYGLKPHDGGLELWAD